jgi:hypothetical protein
MITSADSENFLFGLSFYETIISAMILLVVLMGALVVVQKQQFFTLCEDICKLRFGEDAQFASPNFGMDCVCYHKALTDVNNKHEAGIFDQWNSSGLMPNITI